MSQHGLIRVSAGWASRQRTWIAILVLCAMTSGGCHMVETLETEKCRIPPNYPHDFAPPANYGYFPTLWRPWPGAEAVPGYTLNRRPSKDEEEETTEEEADKSTEETGETKTDSGVEQGLDFFDTPEGEKEEEAMPSGDEPAADENAPESPETTMPDELVPPRSDESPDATESTPDATETMPEPAETMPEPEEPVRGEGTKPAEPATKPVDDPFGPESPLEPPPERSAADLESLPDDAPEGMLVPREVETVRVQPMRPGSLAPRRAVQLPAEAGSGEQKWENARRPAPVRGASATQPELKKLPVAQVGNVQPANNAAEAMNGPYLGNPQPTEQSRSAIANSAAAASATAKSDAAEPRSNWRPSQPRRESQASTASSASTATPREGWQRRASRVEHPGVQTVHREPQPQVESRPAAVSGSGPNNPLR